MRGALSTALAGGRCTIEELLLIESAPSLHANHLLTDDFHCATRRYPPSSRSPSCLSVTGGANTQWLTVSELNAFQVRDACL